MITNVEKLALYDMLPTRKKLGLITYFRTLPDKDQAQVITMDLWSVYRQVVESQFPGRMIVADRWHVLRMANDAMEKTRKMVRQSLNTRTRLKLKDDRFLLLSRQQSLNPAEQVQLDSWEADFPLLGAAYRTKEAFHALYVCRSRIEAEKAARDWKASIPREVRANFRELVNALDRWWESIFNWYECKISNAYTESINRLAKDMNRMGRGYSFEVIRARLFYDETARKPNTKTVRPKSRKQPPAGSMSRTTSCSAFAAPEQKAKVIEYGPRIPTLCDRLESGYFET